MEVRNLYEIVIGDYSDKYLCISKSPIHVSFKRVRMPKTKIDGKRLPENIHIKLYAKTMVEPKTK